MNTWTPATSVDLKGKTPVEYRTLIDQALDIVIDRLPVLENELVDTRQRGLGFMTPDAKAAADEQLRRERAARYPSTTAHGAPIPVGLRGFVRAQAVASMPGERPVPVNLAAVSLAGEIPLTLLHLNQRIRRQLAAAGVCHIRRPLDHPDDTKAIAAETRTLTRVIASKKLLLEVLRAVEDLAQRAKNHVDGNDRVHHHRPCPHCGRRTLVVYLDEGRIVCERDPHSGQYEDCVCSDSYCGCKVRHHRHEWLRNTNASRSNSWQGLNRAQDLAEREANQKNTQQEQGAPTMSYEHTYGQDPAVHRIEVERDADGEVTGARFVCTAPQAAPCRNYPSCECESWGEEHGDKAKGISPEPGHEPVPQDECWIAPWLNYGDHYDLAQEADIPTDELRDGPVEVSWDGDSISWRYVEVATVEHHPGCNDQCDDDTHQLLGDQS